MNAPWSAQQREWLQALGYEVLSPARASGAEPAAQPRRAPSRGEPGTTGHAGHAGRMADERAREADGQRAATDDTALLRALRRAAGGIDADELTRVLADPLALRGDARAKRTAWPRLRALRKARRG